MTMQADKFEELDGSRAIHRQAFKGSKEILGRTGAQPEIRNWSSHESPF